MPRLPLELVPDAWVVSEQLQQAAVEGHMQLISIVFHSKVDRKVDLLASMWQAVLGAATSCGLQGPVKEYF